MSKPAAGTCACEDTRVGRGATRRGSHPTAENVHLEPVERSKDLEAIGKWTWYGAPLGPPLVTIQHEDEIYIYIMLAAHMANTLT